MRRVRIWVMVIGLAVLACGGCGSTITSLMNQANKVLDEGDFGGVAQAQVGEIIDLALQANPTTGYQWRCVWEPPNALELVDDPYVPTPPVLTGSGGVQHFLLRTLQSGTVILTLQYGRWWEGGERDDPHTITLQISG